MYERSDIQKATVDLVTETISIVALRQQEDNRAARLRTEIPLLLARMHAEASATSMSLHLTSRPTGTIEVEVGITGTADSVGRWCNEAESILADFAEVKRAPHPSSSHIPAWPVTVVEPSSSFGYSVDSTPPTTSSAPVEWRAPAHLRSRFLQETVWMELLTANPGHGLRVEVAHQGPRNRRESYNVQLAIAAEQPGPNLKIRSQVRSLLPGLEIVADATAEVPPLRVDVETLPVLLAIPVADATPVAGVPIGSAGRIPMFPSSSGPLGEEGPRLGVGHTTAGSATEVRLTSGEQLRHVHVLGRTGTGKSTLLAGMAHSIAESGQGMLVLDPHGHLVDRIVAELPQEAVTRTRIIRSGDVEHPIPLNPLAVTGPLERDRAIESVCAMFEYLFDKKQIGITGPRFQERVGMALRALAALYGPGASLLDVPLILDNDDLLKQAVVRSENARLKSWYMNEVRSRRSGDYGDLVSWVNSKFEAFTATAEMRAILGSGADAFDMAEAMDTDQIVLVDLSKSHLGEQSARLLGYLHLNRVWTAGLRRTGNRTFTVIVDEVHSMISGALTSILSEGRKFGLAAVIAHQYLDQLDEDLRPAVDGNVATTAAFRCAVSDATSVSGRFGGVVAPATLMTLPDLTAIIQRSAAGGFTPPHTLTVDHNSRARACAGTSLRRRQSLLEKRTWQHWGAPFAAETSCARDGYSRVVPDAPKKVERPTTDKPSFLDEWLARRQQQAAADKTETESA